MAEKPLHRKPFLSLSKFLQLVAGTWGTYYPHHQMIRKYSRALFVEEQSTAAAGISPVVAEDKSVMFHVEAVLLRSSSTFPYFFLVAFEAGGPLRALLLLLLYPVVCFIGGYTAAMKMMVFVCFVGLKEKGFRVGSSVLPKFLLEDVGGEGFEMVTKFGRKTAVSEMPRIMVESFLRDYLGVDVVVGREIKVVHGRFSGLMEETKIGDGFPGGSTRFDIGLIGNFTTKTEARTLIFSHSKAVYLVSEADKRSWEILPRQKHVKSLIFHDGRIGFRPTPLASFLMFMWLPMGLFLVILRAAVGVFLPYKISIPILCFTGFTGTLTTPPSFHQSPDQNGMLYVCNHRTLLDPIYLSMALMKPVTAATYSLSHITELFSPIKTVRLTRNREEDAMKIEKLLSQGEELVICPEGTTCREPYLLRFSPLFAEVGQDIVPVAIDFNGSMFYGTTASGRKFLDPVFVFMNPTAHCAVKILEKVPHCWSCHGGGKSKFEVANYVQEQIAHALGFQCTSLTRRNKYLILAGNEGKV